MSAFELNAEQRAAVEQLAGRVLISAGAGSGKTRVLTERSAEAVCAHPGRGWPGIRIDELLAITFTEKAAGELAERIRGALRALGRGDEARRVDAAWISTIHGMCSRMLRSGALEAGIDPGFSVLEGVASAELKRQAFEAAAQAVLDEMPEAAGLFELYRYDAIAHTVLRLGDALRTTGRRATSIALPAAPSARRLLGEATAFFTQTANDLQTCGVGGEAVSIHRACCSNTASRLRDLARPAADGVDVSEDIWRALAAHAVPAKSAPITDTVKAIRAERLRLAKEAAGLLTAGPAIALRSLTDRYLERYAALKEAASGLDFDDLQIEALRLLRDGEGGREWLDRFKLTMVDEFQDTDALQLEIVELLAGANLCTVGDERQSIYRFRGADVEVYRRHRREMLARGAVDVALATNYRSHSDILRFVNRVFGHETMFGDSLLELNTGRPADSASGALRHGDRVRLLVAEARRESAGTRDVLSRAVAAEMAGLERTGAFSAGEMVILLRSYRHAEAYAEALRREGIDAIVVGGSRFFARPETHALRAFVRLVANTLDEDALGQVLCSGMCGLSDDGLVAIRRHADAAGCSLWDALSGAALGEADKVRGSMLTLAIGSARGRVGRTPLAEVLLRAVEETGYDARLLAAGTPGGHAYANVLKFARLASALEGAGPVGPAEFSAYLDAKEEFGDHEAPATLVDDSSSAVRIMSIHSSKGLEFPVVCVPELGESVASDASFARWDLDDASGTIALSLPSSWGSDDLRRPTAFCELREQQRSEEAEEAKRLLYVALTRAQETLLLAGTASFSGKSTARSPMRLVLESLGIAPRPGLDEVVTDGSAALCRVLDVGALEGDSPRGRSNDLGGARPPEDRQLEWLRAIKVPEDSLQSGTRLDAPRRLSYSSLRDALESGIGHAGEGEMAAAGLQARKTEATRFGSAFHAALEVLGGPGVLDRTRLTAIGRYHGLGEAGLERLRRAIEAFQASDVQRRLQAFPHVMRETPFALRIEWPHEDGRSLCERRWFVLDGSIDLYATDGRQALVVDYKTGEGPMSEDEMRRAYELQASCYALAAARDGNEMADVVFVRPEVGGGPQSVEFPFGPADFLAIEDRLRQLYELVEQRGRSWPEEAEEDASSG